MLHAVSGPITDHVLASLPACLLELDFSRCWQLTPAALFLHLVALRSLTARHAGVGSASLATLPPSLVSLDVAFCTVPLAMPLPALPVLDTLDVSNTTIGDAFVSALPGTLRELRMANCRGVSAAATMDHLPALAKLQSSGTALSQATLSGCAARGCFAPAAGIRRGHLCAVASLALLPGAGGQFASGDDNGVVQLWDTAGSSKPTMLGARRGFVQALAALPDGRRLALGTSSPLEAHNCVEIWDAVSCSHQATIRCGAGVKSLAVMHSGSRHLAAGCGDGEVWVVDVAAADVAAKLVGHKKYVSALAVLPDGSLASGSWDHTIRLWQVPTATCLGTLEGHNWSVAALAVLRDGRLASGAGDGRVRLWDVGSRTCVRELAWHPAAVTALVALPDGQLACGCSDGAVRVWDTGRSPWLADGKNEARKLEGHTQSVLALLALPDGRLVSAGADMYVRLWAL